MSQLSEATIGDQLEFSSWPLEQQLLAHRVLLGHEPLDSTRMMGVATEETKSSWEKGYDEGYQDGKRDGVASMSEPDE